MRKKRLKKGDIVGVRDIDLSRKREVVAHAAVIDTEILFGKLKNSLRFQVEKGIGN